MLQDIMVRSDHANIDAAKRVLKAVGITLVGYEVASDGGLVLRVEEGSFRAAHDALVRAGFRI